MPTQYDNLGVPTYSFPTETKEDFEAINTPTSRDGLTEEEMQAATAKPETTDEEIKRLVVQLAEKIEGIQAHVERLEKLLGANLPNLSSDGTAEVAGVVSSVSGGDASVG